MSRKHQVLGALVAVFAACTLGALAQGPIDAPPATSWEYTSFQRTVYSGGLDTQMNALGSQGWEFCGAHQTTVTPDDVPTPTTVYVFKRAMSRKLPSVRVTGLKNGQEQTYSHEDGRDATALGLTLAVFSTARLEYAATQERWEAAGKKNHVRIAFAQPVKLKANTAGGQGTSYDVDEILIDTTPFAKRPPLPTPHGQGYIAWGDIVDPGLADSFLIRSGDKYISFIKYEGILVDPLITIFGPRDANER